MNLERKELNEIIYLLADLYPEQNMAREFWVRAGGEAAQFYHDHVGYDMWIHNLRRIKDGHTGCPSFEQLFQQAIKEKPFNAAPLQQYLEKL